MHAGRDVSRVVGVAGEEADWADAGGAGHLVGIVVAVVQTVADKPKQSMVVKKYNTEY